MKSQNKRIQQAAIMHGRVLFVVISLILNPLSTLAYGAGLQKTSSNTLNLSIFQTINLPGKTMSVDVNNEYLFAGTKDSLFIFGLTDPQNITRISSLKLYDGLRFLRCYGRYVLFADSSWGVGLIDVNDTAHPKITSRILLYDRFSYTPESVDIYDETAYVTAWHPPFTPDVKIFCVSLANPEALTVISTINYGHNASFENLKSGINLASPFLYLAAGNGFGDNFEIFDLSDFLKPKKASGLDLDDLISGYYQNDMNDIFVKDSVAYVVGEGGTYNHERKGILIAIDISDITKPSIISYLHLPPDGIDLELCGDYAFITTAYYPQYGSSIAGKLVAVDISSPNALTPIDTINFNGNSREFVRKDSLLFVAVEQEGIIIVNTNMPDEFPPKINRGVVTVNPVNSLGTAKALGKPSSITDLTPPITATIINTSTTQEIQTEVASDGSFSANIQANRADGISIYAEDNVSPPNRTGTIVLPKVPVANLIPFTRLPLEGIAKDLEVLGNICCLAIGEKGLAIVDISSPKTPNLLSRLHLNADAEDIKIVGRYVYAACNTGGVKVISIENSNQPTIVAAQNVAGNAKGIEVQGDYVLATVSAVYPSHIYERLCVYKFNGSSLIKLDSLTYWDAYVYGTPPDPYESSIQTRGSYAYICDRGADFVIIDISNPYDIKKLKKIDLKAYPWKNRLHLQENRAYFLGDDIDVYDLTDPVDPTQVTKWKFPSRSQDLLIVKNYVITSETGGVGVFDLSNFTSPLFIDYIGTPGAANQMFLRDSLIYLADGVAGLTILNTQTSEFYINYPPGVFNLLAPVNEDTVYTLNPRLSWDAAIDPNPGDVVSYTLYYADDSSFAKADSIRNIPMSSYQLSKLKDHHAFFWKVKAVDSQGASTFSSQVFRFFTFAVPLPFKLISPALGDTVTTPSLLFTWHPAFDPNPADVVRYKLFYDYRKPFVTPITISDISDTTFVLIDSLANNTRYFWTVIAVDKDSFVTVSPDTFNFWVHYKTTGVNDLQSSEIPKEFALERNYPNPFNPVTTIQYALPKSVYVTLKIFNCLGVEVETLVSKKQPAGEYEIQWNGGNLPSGIYFYRIQADKFTETKKLVILK
jgi:hypothetical protein